MKPVRLPRARQGGAVLVVSLIMLILITMFVVTAYKFSSTNLKSVNNMQTRAEAIAAANKAMEQVIGSWDFSTPPGADQINVDIDNNGSNDYVVNIAAPVCVKAVAVSTPSSADSEWPTNAEGLTIPPPTTANIYNVLWELDATATGTTGTKVRVRQGISKSLTQDQCDAACPPAPGSKCS
jgi:archaellum component FlaF (FlaF/FlaG flagellin family)